jgi:hypothetical protein
LDKRVAFYARNLLNISRPDPDSPLVFRDVGYNEGGGYNNSNGYFTVPAAGTYFFIASTGLMGGRVYSWLNIAVDNWNLGGSYIFPKSDGEDESFSVQALVHVQAGQRVWVRVGAAKGTGYWSQVSAFTGFML